MLDVGINDYLEAYRRVAKWGLSGKTADMKFEAYAETIIRVIADDIARGEWGGTYYMDGRPLNSSNPELYAVGGASVDTEIPLDEGEVVIEADVAAAIQLLRDVIVELQSAGVDDVYIGFWKTDERGDMAVYCFDVSNAVEGFENAKSLGLERGEDAIYHFATDTDIRIARRSCGNSQHLGKGWCDWNDHIRGRK